MANNDILVGVALLERTLPLLNENTRESIRKNTCDNILRNIDMCLGKIMNYTKDTIVLMPLVEASQLIKSVTEDADFVESSDEVKKILIDKIHYALNGLYLFAGKFYMTHDFDYTEGMSQNLVRIINSCISQGFYFGYDAQLQAEGKI